MVHVSQNLGMMDDPHQLSKLRSPKREMVEGRETVPCKVSTCGMVYKMVRDVDFIKKKGVGCFIKWKGEGVS